MKNFLRALLVAAGLALCSVAPASAYPTTLPTPVPTPAMPGALPTHLPTYEKYGTAPSDAAVTQLAQGVTYWETTSGNAEAPIAFANGIKPVFYTDPVLIHGGQSYFGTNVCSGGSSVFPYEILQHDKSYGAPILVPNANQSSCGSYETGSILGDISSPAAPYWWMNVWLYNLDTVNISAGNKPRRGYYAVRIDDALADYNVDVYGILGGQTGWLACAGYATLSAAGTFTTCGNASPNFINISNGSGSAYTITQYMIPYYMLPYPQNLGQRATGIKNFFRAMASAGWKTIWNDDTNPDISEQLMGDPDHSNVEMAQCEQCVGITGGSLYSDPTWRTHVDTLAWNAQHGIGTTWFNAVSNSYSNTEYIYGSAWLGMQDPRLFSMEEQIGGSGGTVSISNPPSGLAISPLSFIVPTQPIADPPNYYVPSVIKIGYQPNSASTGYLIGALAKATGVYVREFAHCYDGHSGTPTDLGACASIVATPAAASSTTISTLGLKGTYAHTVSWTGTGILTGAAYGDSYTLSETTTAAPTTISQGTAVLLFQ